MKREFPHLIARYCAKMMRHTECSGRIILFATHLKILLYNMEKKTFVWLYVYSHVIQLQNLTL